MNKQFDISRSVDSTGERCARCSCIIRFGIDTAYLALALLKCKSYVCSCKYSCILQFTAYFNFSEGKDALLALLRIRPRMPQTTNAPIKKLSMIHRVEYVMSSNAIFDDRSIVGM